MSQACPSPYIAVDPVAFPFTLWGREEGGGGARTVAEGRQYPLRHSDYYISKKDAKRLVEGGMKQLCSLCPIPGIPPKRMCRVFMKTYYRCLRVEKEESR
jgi:hypothetical protein